MTRPRAFRRRSFLGVQGLESRDVPASALVASVAAGSQILLSDAETGASRGSVTAFEGFTGEIRVVLADVTGDGVPDIVAGAGLTGAPRVRVFDGVTLHSIKDFYAFDATFLGGVSVATGDVTGDGVADVIVGAGIGGRPHVRAFNIRAGTEAASFYAYNTEFTGGVNVAAVDLNGDGIDEIVTGAGAGGGPHVRAFDVRTGAVVASFFAFSTGFTGGVNVAGVDPDGDGFGRIVTGAGPGGGPHVRVFENGAVTAELFAGDATNLGGVTVAAFASGDGWQLATGTNAGVTLYDGVTGKAGEIRHPFAAGASNVVVSIARTLLGPVLHGDTPSEASFVDPSVLVSRADRITIGTKSFIAPFAVLDATAGPIAIGNETNVQDNVELVAGANGIVLGDETILAHNATVVGNSRIGAAGGLPCFVGFNAYIDGATVEPDAFVNHLSRLAPGIVLHSGVKTLVGKFIQTQAEADNPALGKVTTVTAGDRTFMAGVLHVNETFAVEYPKLVAAGGAIAVRGIGANTGNSAFSPTSSIPTLHGVTASGADVGRFRNRIVGHVVLEDTLAELNESTGHRNSIRADEGQPFEIGHIRRLADRVTFHALEETEISTGSNLSVGTHAVIHGGPDDGNTPHELTVIGSDVTLGDWSVAFRSTLGAGTQLGFRSYVDGSQLAPGTVVPDRAIIVNNVLVGFVEW